MTIVAKGKNGVCALVDMDLTRSTNVRWERDQRELESKSEAPPLPSGCGVPFVFHSKIGKSG
jgi:hypothetical protein